MGKDLYKARYENSWALIIGINDYQHVSPLGYACQDAQAVADLLIRRFDFQSENVTTLLNERASREAVSSAFLRFAQQDVQENDRIFVFFAGHGHTRTGNRGEVGYLVPADGDPDNLASLVRWDELTRSADLIRAKHVLFIMDACYGGLAVSRALAPGASRFLKDMLRRYSRQVLTAGKADEVVADSGGPRPGHSMFTGHLLDALEGGVADYGIVAASAVMAHVYDRVAKDPRSGQSPHYGFLDGDGDFIFSAPQLSDLESGPQIDQDVLLHVPPTTALAGLNATPFLDLAKDYLSDSRFRIRLDDLTSSTIRALLGALNERDFPPITGTISGADIASRLRQYDDAIEEAAQLTILLGGWGTEEHQAPLAKIVARLAEHNEPRGGNSVWNGLRWYPVMALLCYGGVAALARSNFRSFTTLLTASVRIPKTGDEARPVLVPAVEGMLDLIRQEVFKALPEHGRYLVPESEYFFKSLQPRLEDLLFLGNSYEGLFDRFEIFRALVFADLERATSLRVWGPPGRFGWKYGRRSGPSVYETLVTEAKDQGDEWAVLRFGLFGRSSNRFREIAERYRADVLNHLHWH